ncbi:putative 2OG-Fe(II) oxygenase [Sphingomonas sp. RB1R13]|uniref:putative 2OG-Fe(II) oxygenase n=1 Tax=Sphingomonas sp. RB1R13 TaxID=3096159 RepID=UPI002FC9FAB5
MDHTRPHIPAGSESPRDLLRAACQARERQDIKSALETIGHATRLAPDDPAIALADAHLHHDGWRPAVEKYDRAVALAPGDLSAIKGLAGALDRSGGSAAGRALLDKTLTRHPGWIEGHKLLSTLRLTAGERVAHDHSFAVACAAEPDNLALRLGWFHFLASARDWEQARRVVIDGEARFGPRPALAVAHAFLASESDEASRDPTLFDRLNAVRDPGLDLCRTRFWLRIGQPERAVAVALPHIGGPAERIFWPYLALGWRLLGDPRAAWLDAPGPLLASHHLGLTTAELARLSKTLRTLLTARAPLPEQSVRGGVQTDGMLFFHPDPLIQKVRALAINAVAATIAALPAPIGGHPLLGPPRGAPIRFEGSWAVLLAPSGNHSPHTHSRGWLSSALHLDLASDNGGALEFGAPPPELGLPLVATAQVTPVAGQLHLFASTQWHQTVPFASGERLTIAFDIQIPPPMELQL